MGAYGNQTATLDSMMIFKVMSNPEMAIAAVKMSMIL